MGYISAFKNEKTKQCHSPCQNLNLSNIFYQGACAQEEAQGSCQRVLHDVSWDTWDSIRRNLKPPTCRIIIEKYWWCRFEYAPGVGFLMKR